MELTMEQWSPHQNVGVLNHHDHTVGCMNDRVNPDETALTMHHHRPLIMEPSAVGVSCHDPNTNDGKQQQQQQFQQLMKKNEIIAPMKPPQHKQQKDIAN